MWKELQIDGLKKKYLINENGDIFDIKENKLRNPVENKKGYYKVSFYLYGKYKLKFVHRLVLEHFDPIENMNELQVNHIDGNKKNNNVNNLEWCTLKENMKHAWENKLCKNSTPSGNDAHHRVLNSEIVYQIKQDLKNKMSYRKVAEKYNIHFSTVCQINKGITWKDI